MALSRSKIMARIGSRDTGPELALAAALRSAGVWFRRNVAGFPGTPDMVCGRTAVFVHGCFWHRCPRHYREPRSNVAFWRAKVAANRRRDARVRRALNRAGYSVAVV